ncbi:hypothetical protein [Sneathiella glossodoripedis]|uniref:hypothetical protein n=1 Tax=Sneathiella glossodoripedis TaxID=418853 RepID=UPI0004706696|nr:hypothetical protein [Sneathiella glossodoripedis]
MRFITLTAGLIGFLLSAGGVFAAEQSDAEEIPLYFSANVEKVYLKTGWNADYSTRQFFIVSKSTRSNRIFSVVHLVELAPNYFFNDSYKLQNLRQLYPRFKNANNIAPPSKSSKFADFEYSIFSVDGSECLTFVNETGHSSSDFGVAEGTKRLLGYYCAPERKKIRTEGISYFFKAIGSKDRGEPPPENLDIYQKLFY